MPTANVTVNVTFKLGSTYEVSLNTGANGTASVSKTEGVIPGETITVTANPTSGYQLDKITYTPNGGTATDITSEKAFTMPTANVTVNVTFKLGPTYEVSLNTGANGTASVSKTACVIPGETITVTANPASGYQLDKITYMPNGGTATDITSEKSFFYSTC